VGKEAKDEPAKASRLLMGLEQVMRTKPCKLYDDYNDKNHVYWKAESCFGLRYFFLEGSALSVLKEHVILKWAFWVGFGAMHSEGQSIHERDRQNDEYTPL
jgi:hypothetical protein